MLNCLCLLMFLSSYEALKSTPMWGAYAPKSQIMLLVLLLKRWGIVSFFASQSPSEGV